ncbi:MAG: hypothetical protein FWE69_01720 [Clostridiales bacterium]|nr:hypothetical protein [Clostridiales bacterium]
MKKLIVSVLMVLILLLAVSCAGSVPAGMSTPAPASPAWQDLITVAYPVETLKAYVERVTYSARNYNQYPKVYYSSFSKRFAVEFERKTYEGSYVILKDDSGGLAFIFFDKQGLGVLGFHNDRIRSKADFDFIELGETTMRELYDFALYDITVGSGIITNFYCVKEGYLCVSYKTKHSAWVDWMETVVREVALITNDEILKSPSGSELRYILPMDKGSDDDNYLGASRPTPDITAAPTATPIPTPTPEPDEYTKMAVQAFESGTFESTLVNYHFGLALPFEKVEYDKEKVERALEANGEPYFELISKYDLDAFYQYVQMVGIKRVTVSHDQEKNKFFAEARAQDGISAFTFERNAAYEVKYPSENAKLRFQNAVDGEYSISCSINGGDWRSMFCSRTYRQGTDEFALLSFANIEGMPRPSCSFTLRIKPEDDSLFLVGMNLQEYETLSRILNEAFLRNLSIKEIIAENQILLRKLTDDDVSFERLLQVYGIKAS